MHHLLVLELLSDVTRTAARDLDPGLGEEVTGADYECDVDGSADGV
jgi:hypothetical protein